MLIYQIINQERVIMNTPPEPKPLPVYQCCSSLKTIWDKNMISFFKYPEGKSVMTWVDVNDDGNIEHNCIFCKKPFITIDVSKEKTCKTVQTSSKVSPQKT